jgi:L-amino acid N-acyltransferase YncA
MPGEGPVHLRHATPDDAAGIARTYLAGWQETHAGIVPPEYLACMRARGREEFWHAELQMEAPDRAPWVALLDEEIVGFASGGSAGAAGGGRDVAELYGIAIQPGHGPGIGEGLLRHVLRDLREHGFERVVTWVVAANAKERGILEREGWQLESATRTEDCGGVQVEQVRYSRALG